VARVQAVSAANASDGSDTTMEVAWSSETAAGNFPLLVLTYRHTIGDLNAPDVADGWTLLGKADDSTRSVHVYVWYRADGAQRSGTEVVTLPYAAHATGYLLEYDSIDLTDPIDAVSAGNGNNKLTNEAGMTLDGTDDTVILAAAFASTATFTDEPNGYVQVFAFQETQTTPDLTSNIYEGDDRGGYERPRVGYTGGADIWGAVAFALRAEPVLTPPSGGGGGTQVNGLPVSGVAYRVSIDLTGGAQVVGAFRIDVDTIDGTAGLGGSPTTDITANVRTATVRRGRGDVDSGVQAGECSLDVYDPDGRFNPQNPAGPYYGGLDVFRPARFYGVDSNGTEYDLFVGMTRDIVADPDRRSRSARIDLIDHLEYLNTVYPVIGSTGATTTGAAIGLVLDACALTSSDLRDLDDGDPIPDFSADGSESAVALITALLEAERGMFYVSKAGVLTYRDRASIGGTDTVATFSGVAKALLPGVSLDSVRNRARVTRTGGTQQEANDAVSQGKYGYRDVSAIETPYLLTDTDAAGLASFLVGGKGEPVSPIYGFTLDNADGATWLQILSRELSERVAVSDVWSGVDGTYRIEQVSHTVSEGGKYHTLDLVLSSVSGSLFTIGVSTIDGTDGLVY
jgi:hypothetical protein